MNAKIEIYLLPRLWPKFFQNSTIFHLVKWTQILQNKSAKFRASSAYQLHNCISQEHTITSTAEQSFSFYSVDLLGKEICLRLPIFLISTLCSTLYWQVSLPVVIVQYRQFVFVSVIFWEKQHYVTSCQFENLYIWYTFLLLCMFFCSENIILKITRYFNAKVSYSQYISSA